MPKTIFFSLLSFLLLCNSCKKGIGDNNSLLEKYFETNILNTNFVVSLAKDNGIDITANYNGYIFVLLKTDFYHGPMKVSKNGIVYDGTWSSNSDYSKLTITLPNSPSEFVFLSREWRFTSKNLPTLKFAPWGSNAPVELNMLRQ
jgi:hypothetical protein